MSMAILKASGFVSCVALSLALGAVTPSFAADLRMLSSWDSTYEPTEFMAQAFIDRVKEASGGDINIAIQGPEVIPPFEQFDPLQTGVYDLLFTHGSYHTGQTGLGGTVDVLDADPAKRRESGVWTALDEHYQSKFGVKVIAVPTAVSGYQLLLRQPMENGRLDGLKLRATRAYHKLIDDLGGVAVNMPHGDFYSAAERGVVNGGAFPAMGASKNKLCEVTPYMVRPTFGVSSYLIVMNLDSFNRLDQAQQDLLLEQGRLVEEASIEIFADLMEKETELMIACGGKLDEQGDEWGAAAHQAFADQYWNMAIEVSGEDAENFRALAREHNLTD